TSEGVIFIVTELVRGRSLDRAIARYGDAPWAMDMMTQVASGLAAIHALGIVHRDLKPANILVDEQGPAPVAKIADFRIASLGGTVPAPTAQPVTAPALADTVFSSSAALGREINETGPTVHNSAAGSTADEMRSREGSSRGSLTRTGAIMGT